MENHQLLQINSKQRWLWLPMGAAGAAALGFALFEAFSFTVSNLLVLAASMFVAALISKHEIKIPRTNKSFAPKVLFAFWGIVSLGIAGGVLLAAGAAIGVYFNHRRNRKTLVLDAVQDIFCALAGGLAFVKAFGFIKQIRPAADQSLLIPNEVIIAGIFMTAAYFVCSSLLDFVVVRLKSERVHRPSLLETAFSGAPGHMIGFAATLVLVITFDHFGTAFGLVVIPIAIVGNVAHEIHCRLLEIKTRQIGEASRIHLATVEALATAIDARDQVGVGHVRRTQLYAVGIGKALGLGEDEINALRTGALLHDIGKLAVPDHILNKPGKLTAAEMEKTKIHSAVGAAILAKVGFPYPVVPTVKYNRERWDGSGYPEGLKGNSIPLTARILTVADSYDTLRVTRPYRAAVSRDDACNFLRSRSGTQFDPNIVNTFLRNLRAFEWEVESQGLSYLMDISGAIGSPTDDTASPLHFAEQIKRANREVFTLYEMARDFSSSLNLEETLSLFTKKVGEFVPFDTCLVYLLDESNDSATAVYVEGKNEAVLRGKRVKVGEGATGYVLKKRKSVENVDPSLDFDSSHSEISQQYVAMACIPLIADEKVVGAISLYSTHLAIYEEEHLRLLKTFSKIASDAISKSVRHAETETHALTDSMSGLPNARSLQLQFDRELARAKRGGHSLQVLMLDLDGFKAVNDTFGHKVGDRMLKEIGAVIRNELRDYDVLARYGGDEFVALVPETDSADVIELCRRIETAVCDFTIPLGGDSYASVGVSIGTSAYPNQGDAFEHLIVAADQAMYRTKAFHKQRNSRLELQFNERSSANSGVGTEELAKIDKISEHGITEFHYDSDVTSDLDDTNIVSYSTIN